MINGKIVIEMFSKADKVKGQGVGSAYLEQVPLVKSQDDLFEVFVNKVPKGIKPDIYHIHSVDLDYYFKEKRPDIPTVMYVHFLPTTLDGSIKLWAPIFSVFKRHVINMYKRADELIVVNPCFIKPLVELGVKKENITYIPNFVSKDNFYPLSKEKSLAVRKEYNIPSDSFVVLGVGQIQNRKGVKDFVEVAKMNSDIEFVWAGGFSFGNITDGYDELKKVVNNAPKNVHFIGIVDRDKMNEIYNMSNMLFMPSLNELFPMSILEACNSSKPVLLRDLDLYKEILFMKYQKASDVQGFSEIIRSLKGDSSLYKEAEKDSLFISTYYSKEHVAKMWREYYLRILAKYRENKALKIKLKKLSGQIE
jgi:1,2-diacylglycerol-3-alpha-glucose alpha-1,2-galactosyltransferase